VRIYRLAALAVFLSSSVFGAIMTAPAVPGLPASASASAAAAAGFGSQIQQTAGAISLRSPGLALSGLEQLRLSIPTISAPEQRAAAAAIVAAMAEPAALAPRLEASGLPPAAVARLTAISEKIDAAAKKNPEFSKRVAAERAAGASVAAQAEAILPANLLPTVRAFLAPDTRLDDGPDDDVPAVVFDKTAPNGQKLNIRVIGEATVLPSAQDLGPAIVDPVLHDAIVVGAGYSGLSAAWRLRDKDVIVLERETHPGGLGAQGRTKQSRRRYARGAAYITKPTDEVKEIWKDIGMPSAKKIAIAEPIDSVFIKGKLRKDIWSEKSLKKLPPGFRKFKKDLERMDEKGYFDFDVPEDIPKKAKYLDRMTVEEFLKPYGPELAAYVIDSYDQSAVGGHVNQVGALGFLLFYSDEITTRYTWPGGTAGGTEVLARNLWKAHHHMFRTKSLVREVKNLPDGTVEVTFERDGRLHVMRARQAIVSAPLKVAAKIVTQMPEEQKAKIKGIEYADYLVHDVFVPSGSIWKKGYDTWVSRFAARGPEKTYSFTDFIDGRWVETDGHRRPHDGPGIISIYMPIAPPGLGGYLDEKTTADLAMKAVLELRDFIPGLSDETELVIESNRWPSSIHVTRPGYLTEVAAAVGQRVGNIHFANNNLGMPAFETSLVGGKRAGDKVRAELESQLTPAH
jgi:hypothetical protein